MNTSRSALLCFIMTLCYSWGNLVQKIFSFLFVSVDCHQDREQASCIPRLPYEVPTKRDRYSPSRAALFNTPRLPHYRDGQEGVLYARVGGERRSARLYQPSPVSSRARSEVRDKTAIVRNRTLSQLGYRPQGPKMRKHHVDKGYVCQDWR